MRTVWLLAFFFFTGFLVGAEEFWLEADRFYYAPGETARIHLRTGEKFLGAELSVNAGQVARIQDHAAQQVRELGGALKDGTPEAFDVNFGQPGTHVIVLETGPSSIKLGGEKFAEQLVSEGFDEIRLRRAKDGISGDSVVQRYSRHAKLVLQAGSKTDDTFKKVCSLPLEIIPDKNPADMRKGDRIAFKLLFHGKPLFGAKAKVWNRYRHRTSVQNIFSQQDGMIETHISNPGVWMVSVVAMVPSRDTEAHYRSYGASLVFGVR